MPSGPLLHSQATGVHPGAYVQPTAPANPYTVAGVSYSLPDEVLWVDTSTEPPYALYVWRAYLPAWELVGEVQGGDSCCGTAIPTQPISDTGSNTVNLTSRCGAATRMADYLELYYSRVTNIIKYGLGFGAGLTIAAALDALTTALTGGLELPFLALVQPIVYRTAQFIIGLTVSNLISTTLPALDSSDNATILEGIYKSLPTDGGPITVTADTLRAWERFITTSTMPCGTIAQQLLSLLIGCVSLGSWQELAYFGSYDPKSSCGGWSLLGSAFQGGATLGVAIEQSFQGGATLGVAVHNGFQGGAVLPA